MSCCACEINRGDAAARSARLPAACPALGTPQARPWNVLPRGGHSRPRSTGPAGSSTGCADASRRGDDGGLRRILLPRRSDATSFEERGSVTATAGTHSVSRRSTMREALRPAPKTPLRSRSSPGCPRLPSRTRTKLLKGLVDPKGESLNTVLDTLQQWNEYLHRVSSPRPGSQTPKPNRRATPELLECVLTLSSTGEFSLRGRKADAGVSQNGMMMPAPLPSAGQIAPKM